MATGGNRLGGHRSADERLTEELLRELLEAPNIEAVLGNGAMVDRTLPGYLNALLEARGLKRSVVFRNAQLNETFGYQLFNGARGAGRNTLLQLAFGMALSLRETNRLLQAGDHAQLYSKDRRDAIIIFCLDRGYTLHRTNEELYSFNEETIC